MTHRDDYDKYKHRVACLQKKFSSIFPFTVVDGKIKRRER